MVWVYFDEQTDAAIRELWWLERSDRVVAIIGGAILDARLRRALEDRFRAKDGKTDMNEKIFKVGGPLGYLGPKIDISYQLHMLDKPHRNAMYGISEIRNLFAHQLDMSFDAENSKLTDAAAKLTLHHGETHYSIKDPDNPEWSKIEQINTNKDLFLVNLKMCLISLYKDTDKHLINTNIPVDYIKHEP